MAERELDEHGIPKAFNEAEKTEARAAYIAAGPNHARQSAVLAKYPFLAGLNWKAHQPAAVEKAKVQ